MTHPLPPSEAPTPHAIVPTHAPIAAPAEPEGIADQILGWAKANPLLAGAGVLLIIGFLSGGGQTASQTSQVNANLKDQSRATEVHLRQEELRLKAVTAEAELADQYLNNGLCVNVTQPGADVLITIYDGMPIVDRNAGHAIADGTVVCDSIGNVGFVQGGMVRNLIKGTPRPTVQAQPPQTQEIIKEEPIYVTAEN